MIGSYICAEIFKGEPLHSVDAQLGIRLDDSKSSGDWIVKDTWSAYIPLRFFNPRPTPESSFQFGHIRKNRLLPPLSSMISTKPGFNCSMDGTWFARTPISPDSAGMLTWTLFIVLILSVPVQPRQKSEPVGNGWRKHTHLWTCRYSNNTVGVSKAGKACLKRSQLRLGWMFSIPGEGGQGKAWSCPLRHQRSPFAEPGRGKQRVWPEGRSGWNEESSLCSGLNELRTIQWLSRASSLEKWKIKSDVAVRSFTH